MTKGPPRPLDVISLPRAEIPSRKWNYYGDLLQNLLAQLLAKPKDGRMLIYASPREAMKVADNLNRTLKRHSNKYPMIVYRDKERVYVMLDDLRAKATITEVRKQA